MQTALIETGSKAVIWEGGDEGKGRDYKGDEGIWGG